MPDLETCFSCYRLRSVHCKSCRKPNQKEILTFLGFYATRLVVTLVWCGVIWAILGSLVYPYFVTGTSPNSGRIVCLPVLYLNNKSNLSDVLQLPVLKNISQTYVFICNESDTSYQYCLTTFTFRETCATHISLTVQLFNNLTNPSNFYDNVTLSFDIFQEVQKQLNQQNTTPKTLADIPDGHFFGLIILVLCSSLGGFLMNFIKLPPLLGMMLAGFILRNIPSTDLVVESISPLWSSTLRNTALVIILIRGGLALDAKKLWRLKFVLPLLAILPCIFEGSVDGTISIFYLDMPWQWGLTTGYLLSAISPAVVVPTILTLKENVKGINEGITTLIVAAANIDVVIAISLFSIFLGLVFSEGSIVLDIFRAPIELSLGIVYGVLSGIILWFLPTKFHTQASRNRNQFFLVFGFGLLSLFGGRRVVIGGASLAGAGALGTLTVAFTAVQKWELTDKATISRTFYLVWQLAQPILFGLIGAALKLNDISGSLIGKALLIIITGLIVRVTVAVIVVTGNKFNVKEKVFIAFSWLPKATVQAALGSVALDLAIERGDMMQTELGKIVLTIAVLAIVLTAPLGAILTGVLGPFLLKHELDSNSKEVERQESENDTISKTDGHEKLTEIEGAPQSDSDNLRKETSV